MINNEQKVFQHHADMFIWLNKIAISDSAFFKRATQKAIQETSKHFKVPREEIVQLFSTQKFHYTNDEILMLFFLYGHLRKIRETHQ
jgi:hypothetical protein